MREVPTIRTLSAEDWPTYKRLRLLSLADSPEAFSMTAAEGSDRSDEEWARRLSHDDSGVNLPLVAEVAGESMGLAWGRIERRRPNVANVYQMWVHPLHRQRGAGQKLLDAVIAWARAHGAEHVDLGVTCGDSAARRLYERAGFKSLGMPEALRPESPLMAQPMRLALSF